MKMRAARNALLISVGLVAIYGLLGAFAAPPLAKKLLVERASESLGRKVALDDVKINPFTLETTLRGFRIMEADGTTPFASFDSLAMNGSIASLWHRAPVVDEATLDGFRMRLARDGDTHFNFSDVLERVRVAARSDATRKKDDEPARFSVANLRVVNGAIDFEDGPNKARHTVSAIQIAVPLVSNLPVHVRNLVLPTFSADVDGSPVALHGEALPFDPTRRSHFAIQLRGIDLAKYGAYLPSDQPVKVNSGRLDATISVRFAEGASGEPAVDVAGQASLSDVALANADGRLGGFAKLETELTSLDPLRGVAKVASMSLSGASAMQDQWKVGTLALRGIDIDLLKHKVRIDSLESADGTLMLERDRDGAIAMPRVESKGPPRHWDVALRSANVTGYRVAFADRAVQPPVDHAITIASLHATDVSTDAGVKGHAAIRARLERGGSIDASSDFALEPLQVKGTIEARSIDITPYRPYMAQFPAVAVKSGVASAKGAFALSGKPASLRISYEGDAAVERLVTVDTINKEDLLNWKSLRTRGVKVALAPDAPLRLAVADLDVDGAYSRIVVTKQGRLNVQELISATEDDPKPAPQPGTARPRDIRIDRISFTHSRLNFTDHFIRPNYTADVGGLHGSVTKLSSDPSSRAIVALQGKWDSSSPVLIAGTVNPLRGDLFLDIAAKAQEIDLTKLTAYSQRYAGYGIQEGRLTLDVKYHVDAGKLEGRNRILVDQLTFGDKVDSPDATKLPVLFAVNLLKDKNGRIDLELPISGSLEDPKFEIGAVISQIFSSRLQKAETSPFSLIAAGATEKPDELAYVEFEPGSAELTDGARGKLDTLVKLLDDRPGLKLALSARVDEASDVEAMTAALRAKKLAALPKDASKEIRAKAESEPIELGAEERQALMQQRDQQVRTYLCGNGRLPEDRVVVPREPLKSDGVKARLTRVDFALR